MEQNTLTIEPMWLILHVRRPAPLAWDVFRGPALEPLWARVKVAVGPGPLTEHDGLTTPGGDYDTELVKWEAEDNLSVRVDAGIMEHVMARAAVSFRIDNLAEAVARDTAWRRVPGHIRFLPMISFSALGLRGDMGQEPD